MDQQAAPPMRAPPPPCKRCNEPTRFFTSILDVKRNKPIKVFRCDSCLAEHWDGLE